MFVPVRMPWGGAPQGISAFAPWTFAPFPLGARKPKGPSELRDGADGLTLAVNVVTNKKTDWLKRAVKEVAEAVHMPDMLEVAAKDVSTVINAPDRLETRVADGCWTKGGVRTVECAHADSAALASELFRLIVQEAFAQSPIFRFLPLPCWLTAKGDLQLCSQKADNICPSVVGALRHFPRDSAACGSAHGQNMNLKPAQLARQSLSFLKGQRAGDWPIELTGFERTND